MADQSVRASGVKVSVVLPAFNESEGIAEVLSGLHAALKASGRRDGEDYEILVVDDSSTDGTGELARKGGARVIRHPVNIGYGKSLLTGFEAARFDWILTLDADGSYPPEDALKLLPYAPDADMVVGAREGSFFWGSPLKAFLRTVYLKLAGFVAGIAIPDANSGLRLIRKSALGASMPVLCYGYSLSTTMTLSFLQGGRFVLFVPVSYVLRKGSSKVRPVRDILRTLQIMIQVILFYNPLKFAVYLMLVPAAFAVPFAVRLICNPNSGGDWALLCFCAMSALFVFLFGCLLESRKLHR